MADSSTNLDLLMQIDDLCVRYEREIRLGQRPKLGDYLVGINPANRSQLLAALVSIDVALKADDYKRLLIDQILHQYSTQLDDNQSVDTLRSIIERAIGQGTRGHDTEDTQAHADGASTGRDFSLDIASTQTYTPSSSSSYSAGPHITGYRIDGTLGQGGMGVVYKATQLALNRTVALKMILNRDSVSEDQLRRFEREAKAIAELKDPRFIQIFELGSHRGQPFMALEYIEGGSLESFRRNEPVSEQYAAEIVESIALAMNKAHAIGLVHRDLKPHNILLTADMQPKVADFGLVKRQSESDDDSQQTETGQIMGTACYMSPEQSFGQTDVGPATDIYALGGILYCLLTGRPPYLGKTRHDTIQQLRSEEPVLPSRLRPGISKDLETICLKCLEKDPHKRYRSAKEIADECRRYLTGKPIVARPISSIERSWRWSKRNPLGASLALLIPVVAIGASIAAWHMNGLYIQVSGLYSDVNDELAKRKVAEIRRDEADAKRTVAEEVQNVVLDKSMEGFHAMLFQADSRLRVDLKQLGFRKRLLSKAREVIESIPQTTIDNPLRYRDGAIANQRLGDIALLTESTADALKFYDSAYGLLQRAAAVAPTDSVSFKNLGTICEHQANAQRTLGQTLKAREKAYEALEYSKKWLALDSTHPQKKLFALQGVEEYQVLSGQIALSLGDAVQAGKHFDEAQKIVEEIGKQVAMNKELAGWLSIQQCTLAQFQGEVLWRTNQLELAEAAFQNASTLFKQRADRFPGAVSENLNLSQAYRAAGDLKLVGAQDLQSANDHFQNALAIVAKFYKLNPDDVQVLREAANINYRLGTLLELAERKGITLANIPSDASATDYLRKSVNARQKEFDADRTDVQARMELAIAQARYGDRENAAKAAAALVEQGASNPRLLFQACCTYALCSNASTQSEQNKYRELAFDTLGKLKQAGWKDTFQLQIDPDLMPLQNLEEFQSRIAAW